MSPTHDLTTKASIAPSSTPLNQKPFGSGPPFRSAPGRNRPVRSGPPGSARRDFVPPRSTTSQSARAVTVSAAGQPPKDQRAPAGQSSPISSPLGGTLPSLPRHTVSSTLTPPSST